MAIRNIAIIAHVDHGKTTLVDQMFGQAGIFRENQTIEERVMDSNPLEKERGITILAKNTAVHWNDVKINIVDTPGHADFGGEVERILRMVDGVVLLVDAAEGPMPQTRFVTRKALELDLLPLVVINKVDRGDARPNEVHDEVLELFMDLEATDQQLDAPFLYAVGRSGWASYDVHNPGVDLTPLFDTIVDYFPPPKVNDEGPFQMLVSTLDHSAYVGRIAIGRVERGSVRVGEEVTLLDLGEAGIVKSSSASERARVSRLYTFSGLERIEVEKAEAGDIVALAGLEGVEIGKTVTDPEHRERLRGIAVEEPTLSVDFTVNNSPFAGQVGKYVTTRQLRERLYKELERNVSLRVEDTEQPDTFTVSGRGELHLTILMETMRREGYEFQVSRPRVITRHDDAGELQEPYEEAVIEVPSDMVGVVIERLGSRKGAMTEMKPMGESSTTRLRFKIPARGLFGYRSEFMTDTRGEGILHHTFQDWDGWAGPLKGRTRGVLVADRPGKAVGFALFGLQERATLFVSPGDETYGGMLVGENVRTDDMDVNVSKEKKLTNMRTTASDENIKLEPPRKITLELALEFIDDDELIEVTPDAIRLRKRVLDPNQRKKAAKKESQSS
ncbi:MAG TPA: translational GTPase TypA [Gemmatimonadetes bacterium]|nr:translational GTPase TypA [Gemmatimonadota bacterium]|tara:strand:+ start:2017 stop:3864 length:1848 start_codon:yes stop_codon:yes gene_type:complete